MSGVVSWRMDDLAAARKLARAILDEDVATIVGAMHDDVEWMPPSGVFGPPPHQAHYVGRAEVARWTAILPRREYTVGFGSFEPVGRGLLIPCKLRFHDGAHVEVFVGWVFADGLLRDGRTFASEAAARSWLESL